MSELKKSRDEHVTLTRENRKLLPLLDRLDIAV